MVLFKRRKEEKEAIKRVEAAKAKKQRDAVNKKIDKEAEKLAKELNISLADAKKYIAVEKKKAVRAKQSTAAKEKLMKAGKRIAKYAQEQAELQQERDKREEKARGNSRGKNRGGNENPFGFDMGF